MVCKPTAKPIKGKLVQRTIKVDEEFYYKLKISMAVERTSLQKLTVTLLEDWYKKHPTEGVNKA